MSEPTTIPTPEKAEEGVDALAQVILTFLPDGGLHMKALGDLRPTIAWAMGEFMRSVGDDMFQNAKAEARAKLEAELAGRPENRIVVPQANLRSIPR